jgi:hypothetical protein
MMRIRKTAVTVALAAAALGGMAAPALAASPAQPPYVGHNVGGGLLTRQSLHVGQVINLVGQTTGRTANYQVTAEHRDGEAFYVTVSPRLQSQSGSVVLFMASK